MKLTIKRKANSNIEKYIKALENQLGVVLEARNATDTVNGCVTSHVDGDRVILDITFYEKDEAPTYYEITYHGQTIGRGRQTTIKRAVNYDKIEDGVRNFAPSEGDII